MTKSVWLDCGEDVICRIALGCALDRQRWRVREKEKLGRGLERGQGSADVRNLSFGP